MRPFQIFVSSLAIAVPALAGGCTATTTTAQDEGAGLQEELRALAPAEIIGTIAYGQTLGPLAYTERPLYRAVKLMAAKGDPIDVWVRSPDGDARAWLTSSTFRTLASNDDAALGQKNSHIVYTAASAGTLYIVWREKNREDATFEVSLAGRPPPITTPGFTATPGAYALTGVCRLGNSGNAAAAATATVSTRGTQAVVEIHSISEPRANGFFPGVTAGELTEEGGILSQWSYTEVDRLVTKRGLFRQLKYGPGTYSLLLEGSMDISARPYGAMNCSFGFSAPFVRPAPPPTELPLGVPLAAHGACSVVESYPHTCVPGTAGRDERGCCVTTVTTSHSDSIAFQVDSAGSTRSLRVLQAPSNARNVSGLTVAESTGSFDAQPAFYASTAQQIFTVSTRDESNEAIQCGIRVVTRSCRLVHVP